MCMLNHFRNGMRELGVKAMEEFLVVSGERDPVGWTDSQSGSERVNMAAEQGIERDNNNVNCQNLPIYASAVYAEALVEAAILAASLAALALVEQQARVVKARRGDLASYLVI